MPTPRGYPYPAGTDPADVPADIQALAGAVDTDVADVETDAAAALNAHAIDQTAIHGIPDTAALYRAGGTDVAVADGGTGASTAAAARANLGVDAELALKAPLAGPPLTGTVTIDGDTNLYRAAANDLRTDDYFSSALDMTARLGGSAQARIGSVAGTGGTFAGLELASDVNLFRAAANDLRTDDFFSAKFDVAARLGGDAAKLGSAGPGGQAGVALGASEDVNLYRAAAGLLRTDDDFQAVNGWMLAHTAQGLKVVGGTVNGDGTIAAGTGFTITKGVTGDYTVTVTTPFAATPTSVLVNGAGTAAAQVMAYNIAAGSFKVAVLNAVGAATDQPFSFAAIGAA